MKDKLFVVANVIARPGKEDSLREALQSMVPITQREPGFIQYDLHESLEQPGHFVFYEIWEDEHSLDLHSKTDAMRAHQAKSAPWVQSVKVEKFKQI